MGSLTSDEAALRFSSRSLPFSPPHPRPVLPSLLPLSFSFSDPARFPRFLCAQGGAASLNMDAAASGDWRAQLQPEARLGVVNKITDTLQRQFPVSGPENLDELRKIAVRFEEKIFSAAVNQTDYLRTISMKMITMESRTQNSSITNQMPSNLANQNPPDPEEVEAEKLRLRLMNLSLILNVRTS